MHLPGLDHIVLCVRDLSDAHERFASFGFKMTPHAVHPFGTANCLAQLGHSFIELLGVVEPGKIPPHGERTFSFAAANRDFLAERQGMSMLVLSSDDARADEARWRERGLTTFEPVDFERAARQPDGTDARVAFTIAFAVDENLPGVAFFCCQQHTPQNFWHARYQRHPNGATDLASVTLVAPEPERHAAFFRALIDDDAVSSRDGGLEVATGLGLVEVIAPGAAHERFAGVPNVVVHETAHFAAAAVSVADLDEARGFLDEAGVPYARGVGRLAIPPSRACGLILELV